MNKKHNRIRLIISTMLLAIVFVIGSFSMAKADEEDVEEMTTVMAPAESKAAIAQLHFESADGKYTNISDNATVDPDAPGASYVKVDGGTFTVSLKAEDLGATEKISGVKILCVDISGVKQLLNDYNFKYDVSDVRVECDGTPVEIDFSKLVLGSAEENENLRIEIYNDNGATADDNAPLDVEGFAFEKKLSVTFTISPAAKGQNAYIVFANGNGRYFSTPEKPKSEPVSITKDGTYTLNLEARDSEGDKVKVSGITNFYIEIPGLVNQINDWSNLRVTDVSILCDGEPVEVDNAEIYWGNTKNNGNFRIDFYDEEKASADYKGALDKKSFSFRDMMNVTFTIEGLSIGLPEEVVNEYVYVEPVPEEPEVIEPEVEDAEVTEGTDGDAEPVVTETPVEETKPTVEPTPTSVPSPTPTHAPLRGLNDTIYDKNDSGTGVLGTIGIILGILVVVGGGAAALIFGKEK